MNFLKLDVLWKKKLAHVTRTTTKTIEVKNFKMKHKVLKNHYMVNYGPILKKFFFKCQAKLEFFLNG
jgi:hypothetical protein